nr:MAG TPA: hypothetical protein [Caudoviricetes sp.]
MHNVFPKLFEEHFHNVLLMDVLLPQIHIYNYPI